MAVHTTCIASVSRNLIDRSLEGANYLIELFLFLNKLIFPFSFNKTFYENHQDKSLYIFGKDGSSFLERTWKAIEKLELHLVDTILYAASVVIPLKKTKEWHEKFSDRNNLHTCEAIEDDNKKANKEKSEE